LPPTSSRSRSRDPWSRPAARPLLCDQRHGWASCTDRRKMMANMKQPASIPRDRHIASPISTPSLFGLMEKDTNSRCSRMPSSSLDADYKSYRPGGDRRAARAMNGLAAPHPGRLPTWRTPPVTGRAEVAPGIRFVARPAIHRPSRRSTLHSVGFPGLTLMISNDTAYVPALVSPIPAGRQIRPGRSACGILAPASSSPRVIADKYMICATTSPFPGRGRHRQTGALCADPRKT